MGLEDPVLAESLSSYLLCRVMGEDRCKPGLVLLSAALGINVKPFCVSCERYCRDTVKDSWVAKICS